MSGRSRPSAVVVVCCSSKSQCSAMPAAFTALRSVISPQRPRVCGDRSAVTRFLVSFCSCSWPTCSAATRSFKRGVRALALRLHVPQPLLVAGQGLAQRVEQLCDRLLALREIALGGRADLVELGIGQGEELLVVLRQRLRRELRERAGEQPALLLRPARGLAFGRAQQLELGNCDGTGRLGGRRRCGRGLQLSRQLLERPCASASRPSARRLAPAVRFSRAKCQATPIARPATSPMSTPRTMWPM